MVHYALQCYDKQTNSQMTREYEEKLKKPASTNGQDAKSMGETDVLVKNVN